MKTARAARIASVLLAAALATGLASCAKREVVQASPPRAVRVALAERRSFTVDALYSAKIAANREVDIVPKVGGRVSAVRADVGSVVRSGQVLFTIDPSDYDAQYRQAKAALESASAVLTRTSDASQEQQVIQAKAAADQAQVGYDDSKSLYEKTQRLYDGGVIPKQQLDDVEARYKAAEIQLESAKQNLDIVQTKAGPQNSDVATGQVDQAQAQADLAKSQLDATVVRSPIDGRVSFRNVEAGEMVGTSSLAFIVIDDTSLLAEAGVSERVVGRVARGMPVSVAVDALGDGAIAGRVDSVSPAADPRTMLYQVRVRIDGADGRIRPGMIAKIRIPLETRQDALLIPESAAFSANGSDSAYTVENGRAHLRRITLGESDGSSVEVLSGLSAGESVVTEGQEFLSDGDQVIASTN